MAYLHQPEDNNGDAKIEITMRRESSGLSYMARLREKKKARQLMVLILLTVIVLTWWIYYVNTRQPTPQTVVENNTETSTEEAGPTSKIEVVTVAGGGKSYTTSTGLRVSSTEVSLNGQTVLTINGMPPLVETSAGITYESAYEFLNAILSPDRQYIAFTTIGEDREFGWLLKIDEGRIIPVTSSAQGKVRAVEWSNDSARILFYITRGKTEVLEDNVFVNNLPTFPRLPN